MNENYLTISSIANIIQGTKDVLMLLDADSIELPQDQQVLTNDIQAALAKCLRNRGAE